MNPLDHTRNQTQLVFCRENVDPDFVTRLLGLNPSEALKASDPAKIWDGTEMPSRVGIWKLDLPEVGEDDTIEDQLSRWIDLLRPRTAALANLRAADYAPYLDCKAARGSLSVCIDPVLLSSLGEVGVSLSIWLYESR